MTDKQLMTAYQGGDESAFTALYRKYRDRVRYFVQRYVPSHVAEDVAQDVWVRVIRFGHYYEPTGKFTTWLFTIAKNQALDWIRLVGPKHENNTISMFEDEDDPDAKNFDPSYPGLEADDVLIQKNTVKRIRKFIQEHPSPNLKAVQLRDLDQYTYDEICQILDVPLGTVKSRINRGRKALKRWHA